MRKFIVRRLLGAIPVIWIIITVVFVMVRVVVPGDPVNILAGDKASAELMERIRHKYGLDKSVFEQYLIFMGDALRGDLGDSLKFGQPVIEVIANAFPYTVLLTFQSVGVGTLVGVLVGILTAMKHGSWIDRTGMLIVVLLNAFPTFWLGLILILIFAVGLRILPVEGAGTWQHFVLPVATLALGEAALIARLTRSSLLEILGTDYIRTARAKGLPEWQVVVFHAMKNALIPIVTVVGLSFGGLLGGAVITESIFGLPGVGRLTIVAITDLDYPMIQGTVLLVAVSFVLVNLIVDLIYAYVDPRIHYESDM